MDFLPRALGAIECGAGRGTDVWAGGKRWGSPTKKGAGEEGCLYIYLRLWHLQSEHRQGESNVTVTEFVRDRARI